MAKVEVKYTDLFINNKFVPAKSGKTIAVTNPANEQVFAHIAEGDAVDVDTAVRAARTAFEAPTWRELALTERGALIYKLAELIDRDTDVLAELESADNGKPLDVAKGDIGECASLFRYFAGYADKMFGTTQLYSPTRGTTIYREPVGVCGLIVPWNYPLMMATWKLAPALAAGNAVVVKPSEFTSLSLLHLCSLVVEAGFPPGVVNVVTGYGPAAGEALARHMDVDKLAFTGSGVTGRKVMKAAAESNLKQVTLELGGKSPVLVFEDCDWQSAIEQVHFAFAENMGQNCAAGTRLLIQESIHDKFVADLVKYTAENTKIGEAHEAGATLGPLVNKAQFDKVTRFIELGKQCAKLEYGGKRHGSVGYFVEPTIFSNVPDHCEMADNEIFGPVLSILKPFKTREEAVARGNDTTYGLGSGVFTTNIATEQYCVRNLKAGTVWVNMYNDVPSCAPFGGVKQSGFGRDVGKESLTFYTIAKACTFARL